MVLSDIVLKVIADSYSNRHGPRFIHLSKSNQMFPGAGRDKKARFWLRPVVKAQPELLPPKPVSEKVVPSTVAENLMSPGDAIRAAEVHRFVNMIYNYFLGCSN